MRPATLKLALSCAEAVLLIGVAMPVWAKAVNQFPDAKDSTVIQVIAQQYAWNIRYAGPDGVFGRQDMKYISSDNVFGVDPTDPDGKDDIQTLNEIHVPRRQARHRLCQFQGRDPFVQGCGHARLPGRDTRPADSMLVHAHEDWPLPESIARSSAEPATRP